MSYEEYEVRVYSDRVEWRQDDELHRVNGPAVVYTNGDKEWWYRDLLHREDGPAVDYTNGDRAWYYKGDWLTEAEWQKKVNQVADRTGKVVEIEGKKYKLVEA